MSKDSLSVDTAWAQERNAAFGADRANRVARNAVTSADVMAAARDTTKMRTYSDTFGVTVPKTAEVTNQRQSGRCWFFSAMNALRHDTMVYLDVDTIEFSQAFGMFYDKLEKANSTLCLCGCYGNWRSLARLRKRKRGREGSREGDVRALRVI